MRHFFYLAPIRGITDALFRDIFHRHFPGFDAAVAPFISPQRFTTLKPALLADILPENNKAIMLVPQLLHNKPEEFLQLGWLLQELGYTQLNWNLGCPAPQVANKGRGSGMLPHPEKILTVLEAACTHLTASISLKTRLGLHTDAELARLLPQLNAFPVKEIIIHPRLGRQLYRGAADRDGFMRMQELTRHTLVYNGDITTAADFRTLAILLPHIRRWMIGRGALRDPFLLERIKGGTICRKTGVRRLQGFHDDLFERLSQRLHGPGHLLGRLKQIWTYLIHSFPEKEKSLKKIHKARSIAAYRDAIEPLFSD